MHSKSFYTNTSKKEIFKNKKILLLDSSQVVTGEQNFENIKFKLCEPLIIDKQSRIYLDFLSLNNVICKKSDYTSVSIEDSYDILIDIEEINIKTYSNNDVFTNKFCIPNECAGTTDNEIQISGGDVLDPLEGGTVDVNVTNYNIRMKEQFITIIEPMILKELTVSIKGFKYDGTSQTSLTFASTTGNAFNIIGNFVLSMCIVDVQPKKNNKKEELQLYRNGNYFSNSSFDKKILVLDTSQLSSFTTTENMKFVLLETLHVENITDVYLEFLNIQNMKMVADSSNTVPTDGSDGGYKLKGSIENTPYILMKINEFKNRTLTNQYTNIENQFIMPNTSFSDFELNPNDGSRRDTEILNQKNFYMPFKSYFLTTLTPMKLKSLTITLSGILENIDIDMDNYNKFYYQKQDNNDLHYGIIGGCIIGLSFRQR